MKWTSFACGRVKSNLQVIEGSIALHHHLSSPTITLQFLERNGVSESVLENSFKKLWKLLECVSIGILLQAFFRTGCDEHGSGLE